jgi:hypothetical protein
VRENIMSTSKASNILRALPREKAFYFFTSIGNYTGISAASLKEFIEKIGEVNIKSLEFHVYRGDFKKWSAEVLEDDLLTEELRKLEQSNVYGDILRARLNETVSKRYKDLANRLTFSV